MNWLNAGILLLLVLGHSAIWVSLVNRTHGRPWSDRTLQRIRHLHDMMIPLFPVLVVWFVGLRGPRLLLDGHWDQLNRGWQGLFLICAGGDVWLLWGLLRHVFRSASPVMSNHSTFHDIAADLGTRPVARGPYYALTRVPGNQQFQLELNDKHFHLPGLPPEWENLSILHLSDFHFMGTVTKDYYIRALELAAMRPVDLICFTGDLIDREELLDWLPETLGMLNAPLGRFFILGNHDWYHDIDGIRQAVSNLGWTDLGSKTEVLTIANKTMAISGDETPWLGTRPERHEADFQLRLSHTPDNLRRARKQGVDLMLSGHNHGGQVKLPGIGPVYSPSKFGVRYAGGTYLEPPTLLHVSRGLAGQHPLRWRCPPEISRLYLHCDASRSREP